MEFIKLAAKVKVDEERVEIELRTSEEEFSPEKQLDFSEQIQRNCLTSGIRLSWKLESTIRACHFVTNTGWKVVLLDRGLDVFPKYEMNEALTLANRLQKHRAYKAIEVTYLGQSQ